MTVNMTMTSTPAHSDAPSLLAHLLLHHDINQLNTAYAAALDDKRFDDWPLFFVEDGHYKLQARENFDRGLPLALMALEAFTTPKGWANVIGVALSSLPVESALFVKLLEPESGTFRFKTV